MKKIYIDLETTGLRSSSCAIHQVSGMIEVGSGSWTFDYKVKPHPDALYEQGWDVGGVTRDEVENYTLSHLDFHRDFTKLLATHVNKFDKTDKLFWIGYNSRFDEDFMRALFRRCGDNFFGSYFWTPSLCVMNKAAFDLAPVRNTLPNFQLSTVYQHYFDEELAGAHDGLSDILATKRILHAIEEKEFFKRAPRD